MRGPSRCPVRLVPCCRHEPRVLNKSPRAGTLPHNSEFVQGYTWGFSGADSQTLLVCTVSLGLAAHSGTKDNSRSTQLRETEVFSI